MGELRSKDKNIVKDKTMAFAIRIVNLYHYLKNEKSEYVISNQLLRSGTSIGANYRESQNASSKKDFISKINIALKEANASEYWLELLYKTEYVSQTQYISISSDCDEIVRLLSAILKTSKLGDQK